ncbi:hypothetical protein GPECTOR_22g852 [Gonium pectorale]|uniref:Uncharacterized protein n=1 Tax=Gonium pectorale TaxID=33097 RepID=A0A150GHJ1_GONPE|nr:hypothetical protein GPECTOR_22g852 [Gonium pectorale]|eukprot:KXZ49259.1 hypothetical protein GPECTOR_22g852 [Gonium pectorale]
MEEDVFKVSKDMGAYTQQMQKKIEQSREGITKVPVPVPQFEPEGAAPMAEPPVEQEWASFLGAFVQPVPVPVPQFEPEGAAPMAEPPVEQEWASFLGAFVQPQPAGGGAVMGGAGGMAVEQPAAGIYGGQMQAGGAVQAVGGAMGGMTGPQVAGMMGQVPGVGMGVGAGVQGAGSGGMGMQQQQQQQQQHPHAHPGMAQMAGPGGQMPYGVPQAQPGKDMAHQQYVQVLHQQQHAHATAQAQAQAHAVAAAQQQQQMGRMPSGPLPQPAGGAATAATAAGAVRNGAGMPLGAAAAVPAAQMARPSGMSGMPAVPMMGGQPRPQAQPQQPAVGAPQQYGQGHGGMSQPQPPAQGGAGGMPAAAAAAAGAPAAQPAAQGGAGGGDADPTPAQVEEYWRILREIRARMPILRQNIERYTKAAEQQGPEGKAQRSRRILLEAMKRCMVERGSPEAAGRDHVITSTTLRLVATVLASLDGNSGTSTRRHVGPQPGGQPQPGQPQHPSQPAQQQQPQQQHQPQAAADGHTAAGPAAGAQPHLQQQQPVAAGAHAVKQEPGVAAAPGAGPGVGGSVPAGGLAAANRAAAVAYAANKGMNARAPRPPGRPGQGVARPGADAAAAGRDIKQDPSLESPAPGVDQVTRLLGLLSQPLPHATMRTHNATGAADNLNFDGDSLMPSLPPEACAQLTAAAARAAAAAASCGPPRARTVSVCRVAGMSYADGSDGAGGDGAGGEQPDARRQAGGGGSTLEGHGWPRRPSVASSLGNSSASGSLAALGVGPGPSQAAGAGGSGAVGTSRKRPAPDGDEEQQAAGATAVSPELKRRRLSVEAACQAAEQELGGQVLLRLLEAEAASVYGLESDAWLLECAATVTFVGEDGNQGSSGAESGPGWKRLRVCVPWAYPDAAPVPAFLSTDPSYSHPYGKAARLHFQDAVG